MTMPIYIQHMHAVCKGVPTHSHSSQKVCIPRILMTPIQVPKGAQSNKCFFSCSSKQQVLEQANVIGGWGISKPYLNSPQGSRENEGYGTAPWNQVLKQPLRVIDCTSWSLWLWIKCATVFAIVLQSLHEEVTIVILSLDSNPTKEANAGNFTKKWSGFLELSLEGMHIMSHATQSMMMHMWPDKQWQGPRFNHHTHAWVEEDYVKFL